MNPFSTRSVALGTGQWALYFNFFSGLHRWNRLYRRTPIKLLAKQHLLSCFHCFFLMTHYLTGQQS